MVKTAQTMFYRTLTTKLLPDLKCAAVAGSMLAIWGLLTRASTLAPLRRFSYVTDTPCICLFAYFSL